jgi:uncharacterized protein with ATP-grasp and redox domains
MRKVYSLLNDFTMDRPPTDVANKIYKAITRITQQPDLFREVKAQSNALAKETIALIRPHVTAPTDPKFRFRRGLAAAITGNLIDFGTAGHSVRMDPHYLEETYYQILKEGFAIDDSQQLYEQLTPGSHLLYLADNAGETYFDLLLLAEMKPLVKITLVVKGAPIANDATENDVQDPIFNETVDQIITTGSGSLGVSATNNSREFLNQLRTADSIIAKGQSNFETLYYHHHALTPKSIFFIFRTKCPCIAQFLGQTVGRNIVLYKPS